MSYEISQKMRYDKAQTVLTYNGCQSNSNSFAVVIEKADFTKNVLCPFCLTYNLLMRFEKRGQCYKCPICKNDMMLRTLIKEITIPEFARWVFDYRLSGFWTKVYPSAKLWFIKLKELGFSYEFWENYNRLKGESKANNKFNEDYE